jgi:hypothetical protein
MKAARRSLLDCCYRSCWWECRRSSRRKRRNLRRPASRLHRRPRHMLAEAEELRHIRTPVRHTRTRQALRLAAGQIPERPVELILERVAAAPRQRAAARIRERRAHTETRPLQGTALPPAAATLRRTLTEIPMPPDTQIRPRERTHLER